MNVVRYEPWNLLDRFYDEVSRMARDPGRAADADDRSRVVTSHWSPSVDIREENDRFVLVADVPGVDPKDIDITMADGVLTVKGERGEVDGEVHEGYKRRERVLGSFYRRFSLPDTADAEGITARGSNGVLEITIPKHEKLKPRRITVN